MTSPAERLTGLLSYLEQVDELRRSTAFSVPDEYFCALQSEIDGLPGVGLDLPHGEDDVWLSLPRLGEIPPPPPSAALEPWIAFSKSIDDTPHLHSEIMLHGGDEVTRLSLRNFPGLSRLLDAYLVQQWNPWAAGERPRRRAIALYNRLFALYRMMQAGGVDTPLDLVWGMGMTVWKPPGGRGPVTYPLITQSCELSLDEDTLELAIYPRAVDAVLELEPYVEPASSGVAALATAWAAHLKSSQERPSPFNPASTVPIFKTAVTLLDAGGRFDDTIDHNPIPAAGEHLLVTDRWILFARRRSDAAHRDDIRRFKRRIEENATIPVAPAKLLGADLPEPEMATPAHPGTEASLVGAEVAGRAYLPLPFNDEQRAVVDLLERNAGVVVEAPPGTGATQTVANLICHCLATDQRVLVISPIESSLARTQLRIPTELRSLTVAVVSDERRGMRQFAQCVKHLSERLKAGGAERLEQEVASQEARLSELRRAIAEMDTKLGELAECQFSGLPIDDGTTTPADLARTVIAQAPAYDWLTDPLDPSTQREPRVTEYDISELRTTRVALGADLAHLRAHPPDLATLPDETGLLALNRELAGARRAEALADARTLLALLDSTPATLERAAKLRELLRRRDALRAEIAKDPFAWSGRLRGRFEAREDGLARDLITAARSVTLEELARRTRQNLSIEIPADAELSDEVMETVARRAEGRFSFRLPLGGKDAKAVLDAISIDGEKPEDSEGWGQVAAELEHRTKARKLLAAWNTIVADCRLEPIKETGPRAFRDLAARAEHVLQVHELVTRVEAPIRAAVPTVFPRAVVDELPDYEEASYTSMMASLNAHLDRNQATSARARLRQLLKSLEDRSGPIVDAVWQFLTGQVGRDDSPEATAALAARWRGLLDELTRIAKLAPLLMTVERCAALVEESGASGWANRLRTVPAAAAADPVTPSTWREAWRWRIAVMLLGALEGHDVHRQLLQRRHVAAGDVSKVMRSLVVDRAWLAVLKRPSERLRQALREYTHSLRALSHGGGARATRNRQISSDALAKANAAVPCWLLPVWRVPELTPAEFASFDVVVVEEASRVDVMALGALLRGRKLVVIGDGKQLPPPVASIDERKLKDLGGRFLANLPHAAAIAPGRSLLELAHRVFSGSTVTMREQFGSDLAIIELANRDVYEGALEPLRAPVVAHRLEPALVDVHVVGGLMRDGINEAEVLAIIAEIESILADESLAGRSIGVASLIGAQQARRIEQLVCERIALRHVVGRRILVGMPAAFQGCERALMLLSLGLAPKEAGGVAAAVPTAHFNVASVRSVERILLFRSLAEGDMPAASPAARLVRDFAELTKTAKTVDGSAREHCETEAERELFDVLAARGFRVRPRFRVGPIMIDLLVEGSDGRRLAIECDGDRPAGAEDWRAEFSRQQTLERLGWTIWRCFASSLVLRREHVIGDLWGTLERLGIDAPGTGPPADAIAPAKRSVQASLQAIAPTLTSPVGESTRTPRARRRPSNPE